MKRAFLGRWGGPLAIVLVAAAMLRWTWGTWPDVLIDFGRELYIPWQLLEGRRLYADMAYFYGPLSPYLNAGWFRLMGVGLRALVLGNLLLLAWLVYVLYQLLSAIGTRRSATIACLVFLALFAFGELTGIGNYNFVCPYAHELTHGVILALTALWALYRSINVVVNDAGWCWWSWPPAWSCSPSRRSCWRQPRRSSSVWG